MNGGAPSAVLLASHGTVDRLDDLPAFVTRVRRGHPPPPGLIAELRRRYEAIGGRSPLHDINAELARKLSRRMGLRVAWGSRLWEPGVKEALAGLSRDGVRRVAVVPLAQHSAAIYADDARRAAEGLGLTLACAGNWGRRADLCEAFAARIRRTLEGQDLARTTVVLSAHSLPRSVVERGDPYEIDARAAAQAVGDRLGGARWTVCFQSQGMSGAPGDWLGPDIPTTLDALRDRGDLVAVFAPIGFLADHVEILYDLDIEAAQLAAERGLRLLRVPSLNADDDFVEVLAAIARPLVDHG